MKNRQMSLGVVLVLMSLLFLCLPVMAQEVPSNSSPQEFSLDHVLVLATMFVASILVLFKDWVAKQLAEKLADYSDPKVTKEVFDEGYRRGLEHGINQAKATADPKDDLFWKSLIDSSGMVLVQDATGYHVIMPKTTPPAPAPQPVPVPAPVPVPNL